MLQDHHCDDSQIECFGCLQPNNQQCGPYCCPKDTTECNYPGGLPACKPKSSSLETVDSVEIRPEFVHERVAAEITAAMEFAQKDDQAKPFADKCLETFNHITPDSEVNNKRV